MIHSISGTPSGHDDLQYGMYLAGEREKRKTEKNKKLPLRGTEKKNGNSSQKPNK